MVNFKATIKDKIGLHARPAAILVTEASKFKSDIQILSNGRSANLKSIMGIMGLGILHNQEVEIQIQGEDEQNAITAIKSVMTAQGII